jgi:GT2 family glycosyltransferase
MDFSVIIPNFNGAKFLPDCLKSLLAAAKHYPGTNLEIILSDNASTDSSLDVFKKYSHNFIVHQTNLGFGEAVNRAALLATKPYLLVANNDLKLDLHWFEKITKAINLYPKAACFYGLVLNKTGDLIESEGFKFFSAGRCENINNGKPYQKNRPVKGDVRRTEGLFPIWGAPASLIVYRHPVFEKLGGFDSRFFAYIEDVDFSFRLHYQGFVTMYIPQAISYHLGGATSNKMGNLRVYMTLRNWLFFLKKNYSLKQIILNLPAIFLERLKNLKYFLTSTPAKLWLSQIRTLWIDLLNFDHLYDHRH